uniref:Uncharacterized protein n=1 Tax=viral metagenome TaxID=1070528 RepID=A0A6C0HNI2_9ZZZZ
MANIERFSSITTLGQLVQGKDILHNIINREKGFVYNTLIAKKLDAIFGTSDEMTPELLDELEEVHAAITLEIKMRTNSHDFTPEMKTANLTILQSSKLFQTLNEKIQMYRRTCVGFAVNSQSRVCPDSQWMGCATREEVNGWY